MVLNRLDQVEVIKMRNQTFFFFSVIVCFMSGLLLQLMAQSSQFSDSMNHIDSVLCPNLTGRVIVPGEPNYDKARLVSNYYPSKNSYPDVIVYCQSTRDVQNAIRWARCHKVPIRVRSGGHNHEGFSTGTGVIIIDVSDMKNLEIDQSKTTAKVQAGVNNKDLYDKLYEEGVTHVGGTCSEVSLPGLILSGGMGPLIRRQGMTCDNVIELEVVDAEGQIVHATKNNAYKDLFWACCGGGGGNFGIITSMTIKVYPATPVTWFNIGWDWNQPIEQVMMAWQEFFSKVDRRWFSHLDLWSKPFPVDRLKKQPLKAIGVFWGTPEEARQALAPLLNIGHPTNQTIEAVNWNQAMKFIENSTAVFISSKPEYRSIGAYAMDLLPPEAIKIIHETLENTSSPLFNVLLFSLGGASKDIPKDENAYFYRDAQFFVMYTVQWLNKKNDRARIKELDQLRQRLLAYNTEGNYIGNPDPDVDDYLTTYYGNHVHRLRCIKRKYDPHNIFNFQQSIPPAPATWKCSEN